MLKPLLRTVLWAVIGLGWLGVLIAHLGVSSSRLLGVRPLPWQNVIATVVILAGLLAVAGSALWLTRKRPMVVVVPIHAVLIYLALILPWAL